MCCRTSEMCHPRTLSVNAKLCPFSTQASRDVFGNLARLFFFSCSSAGHMPRLENRLERKKYSFAAGRSYDEELRHEVARFSTGIR
jgi:hypothetical protein